MIIGIIQHGWDRGWIEGTTIYMAVIVIISVTAGNNWIKEKQFQKLVTKANEDECACFRGRNGGTQTLSTTNLVVGDVIKIEAGMKVPADCIVIDGTDLATDESSMTGEPDNMEKVGITSDNFEYNPNPFMYAATLVISGQGTALVCAVGTNTQSGMAEEKLNIEEEATPLQLKLETIANTIGKVGVYVAILTFIAMTVNLVVSCLTTPGKELVSINSLNEIVKFLIIAVTVIVVAVPEGLPLAVTISLAFSVIQMKKDNNLVRKLEASETMGGANEICTDKTGTLTQNKMHVREVFTQEAVYSTATKFFNNIANKDLLTEAVLFNCSARIEQAADGSWHVMGNCTEKGLIELIMDQGVPAHEIIRQKDENILQQIPFNSKRKRACTAIQHPNDPNLVRIFCKGAPEIVVEYCTKYMNDAGEAVDLKADKKEELLKETLGFARKAYRTLLVSFTDISKAEYEKMKAANNDFKHEEDREALESGLKVIGIFALQDPLRPEIVESVRQCHGASINIRMVTGDNIETAKAIAIEAGIIRREDIDKEFVCMTG